MCLDLRVAVFHVFPSFFSSLVFVERFSFELPTFFFESIFNFLIFFLLLTFVQRVFF